MNSQKKLSKDAAEKMRICAIDTVRPYALMMAPVYVYMKLNERFVMVKGALDFFSEEELERMKPFGSFFFPEDVDKALRFRKVAMQVRDVLSWDPESAALQELKEKKQSGELKGKDGVALAPASYEISDAVIRLIGPLWGFGPGINPFFVSVFVNELCDLLPGEMLKAYRDQSIISYEKAVICSSWAVFLALHLGYTELPFLNRLRRRLMHEAMTGQPGLFSSPEINELAKAARESLGAEISPLSGDAAFGVTLRDRFGITSEKLTSRMRRVERLARV